MSEKIREFIRLANSVAVVLLLRWVSNSLAIMDALLRQSRAMCPFLKSTCPATLRSLSTTTRRVSPGGGTISNLQIIARRCPVMGKAMAVQTAKNGRTRLDGVLRGLGTYSAKAKIHTASSHRANVNVEPLRRRGNGMIQCMASR